MLSMANYIKDKTQVTPIFLLGSWNMFEKVEIIEGHSFRYIKIIPYEWAKKNKILVRFILKLSQITHMWILSGYFFPNRLLVYFDELYCRIAQYYENLPKILSRLQPQSVVFSDDRSLGFGFNLAALKVCSELDIPRIIPPISYASDKAGMAAWFFRQNQGITANNKLYQKYPLNLLMGRDAGEQEAVSFYSPAVTEVLYRLNCLPRNPWVMGGGYSTKVLVDSEDMALRYKKNGCESNKIIITGHPSHDDLYYFLKKKRPKKVDIKRKYDLQDGHLTILALPQLGEHNILPWDQHWKEIQFLCKTFSESSGQTLISLHPKMDIENYKFIEDIFDIRISDEPLKEILPIADSFASTFSSTVEWAVLCRIPTVVFDFYNIDYDMYDEYKGVVIVNNKKELSRILNEIKCNKIYYEKLRKGHRRKAKVLSPFDGKCMSRVVRELIR